MIPLVAQLKLRGAGQRCVNLWIPLFLVWLVLLPFAVLLAPLAWVGCLAMRISFLRLVSAGWSLLTSLGHTDLEIDSPDTGIFLRVR